jgi:hypothetical protein
MKAFLLYTSLRLALFVAAAGILYVLGMHDLLLVAVALLVSGLLSFTLLSGQRDQMSAALAARKAAFDQRNAARTAAEDAANDAMREAQEARLAGPAAAGVREDDAVSEAESPGEPVEPAENADPAEPEPPRNA